MTQQPAQPQTIHFDIGRITLHGYSPGQRARFVGSLQARLAGLAASSGHRWPATAQRIGHLDAGVLRAGAAPEEAAEQVAASLFAAVAGGRTEASGHAEDSTRAEASRRVEGSEPAGRPGERDD